MGIIILFLILAGLYIYPVFFGLVVLPLDLLVSNSSPWFLAGQILIKNSFMQDSIVQLFPWRHFTYISLTSGTIPLWNPYQLAGIPFMAGMKSMVFYPLNILFVFGETASWNMLVFFQLFLACYFCYLFVRAIGVSIWGSILSAMAFAYSSLMVCFLEFGSDGHSIIWLPLLLYCTHMFFTTNKARYIAGLTVGVACAIFAGHLQMVVYQSGLLIVYFGYAIYGKICTKKQAVIMGLSLLLGWFLAGVQLVPSFELFTHSFRGGENTGNLVAGGLFRGNELLRFFSPDLFGNPSSAGGGLHVGYIETGGYYGLIPLFFTIYALRAWKKNRIVRFFAIVGFVAMILAIWPFGMVMSLLHIPVLSSASGGRIFSLTLFSFAVLSGFGLDKALAEKNWKQLLLWVLGFTTVAAAILVGAYMLNTYIVAFGATFANIKFCLAIAIGFLAITVFLWAIYPKRSYVVYGFIIALLCITYIDLFRMGYRFLTFSNSKFMYPDIPVIGFVKDQSMRSLSRVYGLAQQEIPTFLGIPSIETYNSLYPVLTAEALRALEGKSISDVPQNIFQFASRSSLKHVLDVLGVSYIVVGKDQNPSLLYLQSPEFQGDFIRIYSDDRHDVYLNAAAHPRFGLYYRARTGMTDKEILSDMKQQKTDLRTTLLLSDQTDIVPQEGTGSAKLLAYDTHTQRFLVQTDSPAYFYISDTFFPGWKAVVNDIKTPIYRANYAFRAVPVPKGVSEVLLSYDPDSFKIGLLASGCALVFLVGLVMCVKKYNKAPNAKYPKHTASKKRKTHTPGK